MKAPTGSRCWKKAEVLPAQRLDELKAETDELIAILTAIILKTKRRPKPSAVNTQRP